MKQILACALALSLAVSAEVMADEPQSTENESSELYVGLDLFTSSNTFTEEALGTSIDTDLDSDGFKLKFGANSEDNWRVQGYFLHETYDKTVFDNSNDALNEIGVDVIKAFEVTPEFLPFIQAGVGYGWMDIENSNEDSIAAVNLKVGAGAMYKITKEFEVLAGVDFQYRTWQDRKYLNATVETSETSTRLYFGTNYHF